MEKEIKILDILDGISKNQSLNSLRIKMLKLLPKSKKMLMPLSVILIVGVTSLGIVNNDNLNKVQENIQVQENIVVNKKVGDLSTLNNIFIEEDLQQLSLNLVKDFIKINKTINKLQEHYVNNDNIINFLDNRKNEIIHNLTHENIKEYLNNNKTYIENISKKYILNELDELSKHYTNFNNFGQIDFQNNIVNYALKNAFDKLNENNYISCDDVEFSKKYNNFTFTNLDNEIRKNSQKEILENFDENKIYQQAKIKAFENINKLQSPNSVQLSLNDFYKLNQFNNISLKEYITNTNYIQLSFIEEAKIFNNIKVDFNENSINDKKINIEIIFNDSTSVKQNINKDDVKETLQKMQMEQLIITSQIDPITNNIEYIAQIPGLKIISSAPEFKQIIDELNPNSESNIKYNESTFKHTIPNI